MSVDCGCQPCGDDSVELCSAHQYQHDHGGIGVCRECGGSWIADELTDGYCPDCGDALNLKVCDGCGKALPAAQIATHRYLSEVTGRWHTYHHCAECPPENDSASHADHGTPGSALAPGKVA